MFIAWVMVRPPKEAAQNLGKKVTLTQKRYFLANVGEIL